MEPATSQGNSTAIPIAIVAGFAMIALAIYLTSGRSTSSDVPELQPVATDSGVVQPGEVEPVDASDYILGNPNAEILIVEYSDYDCAFCKDFHSTLHQIMDEYGVTGRVAWVYRQFPIGQLHPNSPKISEAALCVGEIGGNNAFWSFTDQIFDGRDIEELTNVTKLPEYAVTAGVNKDEYIRCMDEGRQKAAVDQSVEVGFNLGIRGTPYTVLMVGNDQATLTGAESYETLKGIIENLLSQLNGTFDPATADTDGTTAQ